VKFFTNAVAGASMRKSQPKYSLFFIFLHWLLAVASVILAGLGWYLRTSPTTTDVHVQLAALHVSLGLSTGVLVVLMLLFQAVFGAPPAPQGFEPWRRGLGLLTHALIYVSLLALVATGYLQQVYAGVPVEIWGTALPIWIESNEELAQIFARAHPIAGYVFAGAVLLHLLLILANALKFESFAGRMLLGGRAADAQAAPAMQPAPDERIVRTLVFHLSLFGWLQFWLQFVLAFVSALLLQFATSGRILSSLSLGVGDAMHWGGGALALLCLTCPLAFGYTRIARRVAIAPQAWLEARAPRFWRVTLGFSLSLLGGAISFIGVALSIVLLVAKTVSQPPGIAITDPTKIIRALDVFVLLMNFTLLLAHSVGVGVGFWLGLRAKRAHDAAEKLRVESPPPATVASAGTETAI